MRAMKDSGIAWIGEIPEDWEIARIKQLFSEVNDRCESSENYTLLSVSEYYGIAPKSEKISDDDMLTHAETLDGYKICKENDLVMNIMLAWKRALGVSKYVGIVSPAYCVFRKKRNMYVKYFHYLFRTDIYANLFKQYSTGIIDSRLRLYPDKFLSLKCQVPPLDIQHRIADYLDRKCSQIDAIIARQQEVIEKLKAYKLSRINEIVVEVEGITAHLGYVSNMKNGLNFNVVPDGKTLKFLGVGDFKDHYVLDSEEMFSDILIDDKIDSDYMLQSGDIIFVRSNGSKELVGRAVMVENVTFPLSYSGFCIRFRNLKTDILKSKYLLYFFRSPYFRKQLEKYSQGSNITNINQVLLSQISIIIPPIKVQDEAIRRVEKLLEAINKLIKGKQEIVSALERYKKSLIYEVVTGKKEV